MSSTTPFFRYPAAWESAVQAPARVRRFLDALTRLADAGLDPRGLHDAARAPLAELVAHDDWLPARWAQPDPERYQQFLLYRDPAARFSVVSFVWGPGQATPVHDHTVWGLIGMLRGAEYSQPYRLDADGRAVAGGAAVRLAPGQVEAVGPEIGDIHRVHNAYDDRVSISIHVYGADIGEVERWVYRDDGTRKRFISGYTQPARADDTATAAASGHPADAAGDPVERIPSFVASTAGALPELGFAQVRAALLARNEIALIDLREEDEYARGHPLWAANFPLSRLELDAWTRIPRRDTTLVLFGEPAGGATLVPRAAAVLRALGYTQVHALAGGLAGWRAAGGELFIDVNVPSKSFGELVEVERHTPSLSAPEVQALIDKRADIVIVDARRFDEYQTMSIPTATSVPGAELVLRVRELAPDPATRVIVNCAGRTRSIIGAQSLVNAGLPNPVAALRNGTIGWTLAGQRLEHGASRRFPEQVSDARRTAAREAARHVAVRAGVQRLALRQLSELGTAGRTVYRFDVRTPEEYAAGHLPGFLSAPGGQLVQETDHHAPVRGARIVLADDDGIRADMSASWLAQMGWEVYVLEPVEAEARSETGPSPVRVPRPTPLPAVIPTTLAAWLHGETFSDGGQLAVIDVTPSANYERRHIPGAWFAIRANLREALAQIPRAKRYVVTCGTGQLAAFAGADMRALLSDDVEVILLEGGTLAWIAAGLPLEHGETRLASPRIDRYRRPYEGTASAVEAMQAYLDWEYGLVEQLGRDGTHGFRVI
jgi:rhodanese-related sulfurtransferase/predicted metal-dependent enzyme (double-stranded beta helix superfamily)